MLAYLMLFAALTNAVCLNNAYLFLFFIDLSKCFLFSCFVFVYFHMNDCSFSFFFASCTVLLICLFFLIICSHRCFYFFYFFFLNIFYERAMSSPEK